MRGRFVFKLDRMYKDDRHFWSCVRTKHSISWKKTANQI